MIKGSRYERRKSNKEETNTPIAGEDRKPDIGGGAIGCSGGMPPGRDCPSPAFPLEGKIPHRGSFGATGKQARPQGSGSRKESHCEGTRADKASSGGHERGAHAAQKKRELGLHGSLKKRHLSRSLREDLLAIVDEALKVGESFEEICRALEVNPRAVYRWRESKKEKHGGGGGHNRILPMEEKRVVALAKNHPEWRCRRIAYELERRGTAFIGKTKVAEILKKHGLNHAFERGKRKDVIIPADMLLHEPWRKNLIWGMDWTWVTVAGRFYFLLVLLDWYSRKILSWGLYQTITKFEVVAVATDAVAIEGIDLLPEGAMKPFLVADHGSANTAKYTKANIEVQGLHLWLSGIGRPTGNARTERVIGTLKREEIHLQPSYESEKEANQKIGAMIEDYNFRRPNAGAGGFAPNSVHHQGRWILQKRREEARQETENRRRKHWNQEP